MNKFKNNSEQNKKILEKLEKLYNEYYQLLGTPGEKEKFIISVNNLLTPKLELSSLRAYAPNLSKHIRKTEKKLIFIGMLIPALKEKREQLTFHLDEAIESLENTLIEYENERNKNK